MKLISSENLLSKTIQIPALLLAIVFILGLGIIGYVLPREEFFILITAYFFCFGSYLSLFHKVKIGLLSLKNGLLLAIIGRVILIFSIPSLSDDFYRFLFDGHLILRGFNPYLQLPETWIVEQNIEAGTYLMHLYQEMNSISYFSVYPPLHQVFFFIAALTGESLIANLFVLRLILIAFDLFNFYLLVKLLKLWALPGHKVLLYALNPLVILELTGNLHFEGLVLSGLLCALYFFERQRISGASISWAAAVGVKLTPLILGPLLLRKAAKLGGFLTFLVWGLVFFVLFFGVLAFEGNYFNFWQSLRLYQSNFEFNASFYYLLRWTSTFFMDYNPIVYLGPFLNGLALLLILGISNLFSLKNRIEMPKAIVLIYLVFLFMQTVVHPWYLIPAFGLSVLTGYRFFMIWTGLVFLSYSAYQFEEVKETPTLILIQYLPIYYMAIKEIIQETGFNFKI